MSKIPRYKSAIKIQEQVIRKLEILLNESCSLSHTNVEKRDNSGQVEELSHSQHHPRLDSQKNADAERDMRRLKDRVRDLEDELEEERRKKSDSGQEDELRDLQRELEKDKRRLAILFFFFQ